MSNFSIPVNINVHNASFTSPKPPSIWSRNSFLFLFLNILTGGCYSSITSISRQMKIRKLELDHQMMSVKIHEILKKWDKLEEEIKKFQEKFLVEEFSLQQSNKALKDLEAQVFVFSKEDCSASGVYTRTITSIAVDVLQFLGHLFLNVVTVGFYGWIKKYNYQEPTIINLQSKTHFIQSEMKRSINTRIDRAQTLFTKFHELLLLKEQSKILASTEEGQASLQYVSMLIKYNDLNRECADLQRHAAFLKMEEIRVKKLNLELEHQIRQQKGTIDSIEDQKNRVVIRLNEQAQQIMTLTHDKARVLADLQRVNDRNRQLMAQVDSLRSDVRRLTNAQAGWGDAQRMQADLGPIAPLYVKQKDDKEVPGDFDTDPTGDYARYFNIQEEYTIPGDTIKRCKPALDTLPKVIEKAFDAAFKELLKLASDETNSSKPKIKLNNSKEIWENDEHIKRRKAIFNFMMFYLIRGAEIHLNGCAGYRVKFNEQVSTASSRPYKAQTYKVDSEGNRVLTQFIKFYYTDALNPEPEGLDAGPVPFGVDPVGLAWLLRRLNDEERNHLFNLILEPLISDDHPELIATKEFMQNKSNERVKLIDIGCTLIEQLGTAAQVFNDWGNHWLEYANEDIPISTVNKNKPIILEPVVKPIVEWTINQKAFESEKVPDVDQINQITVEKSISLVDRLKHLQNYYKVIYDNLSRELLALPFIERSSLIHQRVPKDPTQALALFQQQFHISHEIVDTHGCLFSNLATFLLWDKNLFTEAKAKLSSKLRKERIQQLKNAIANFLDDEQNASNYVEHIKVYHGHNVIVDDVVKPMTVADYKYWLRSGNGFNGNRKIQIKQEDDLGWLEIELTAQVLGIQFAVFQTGEKIDLDSNGLMIPARKDFFIGPNTKQRFYLFNGDGLSYYGLHVKLKKLETPFYLADAIERIQKDYYAKFIS